MGIADIIPGVSGGTIALITGIYERLISAISSINKLILKPLSKLQFKEAFQNILKVDFALLVPLAIGIGIAFLALAHLMEYLLLNWTGITYAFFFGLILSSAIFVYKQASKNHKRNFPFGILGLIFAFWFVGLNAFASSHSLLILFFSGAIAICAMILPGISGSFILVLLGQYEFMISALKNLVVDKIAVFMAGALIGILSFSKLLEWLLKKYKSQTMSFLTGIMIGSLRLPFSKLDLGIPAIFIEILVAIIGFGLVFILERKFSN